MKVLDVVAVGFFGTGMAIGGFAAGQMDADEQEGKDGVPRWRMEHRETPKVS